MERETRNLADEIATEWIRACEANPLDPTDTSEFAGLSEKIHRAAETNMFSSVDGLLDGASQAIARHGGMDQAVEFIQAVMSGFDLASTDTQNEQGKVAGFLCLPVIGQPECAKQILDKADELRLVDDLVASSILPAGAHVNWLPEPVTIAQAGTWAADIRRSLLVSAISGDALSQPVSTPEQSLDLAQLSMLVGIVVMPEEAAEAVKFDPAFLYSDPGDFDEISAMEQPSPDWPLNRRMEAINQASASMTHKIEEMGIDQTIIEGPGVIAEGLGLLVAWSLRVQLIQEATLLKISPTDLAQMMTSSHVQIAVDPEFGAVSMMVDLGGHAMGPYQTDWPWRSLPVDMVMESMMRMGFLSSPEQVSWHGRFQSMWDAVKQGGSRRMRFH